MNLHDFLNEEGMSLGSGKLENQQNAINEINRYYDSYLKNKNIVKNTGYNIGPLKIAQKIIHGLNNPKLDKYVKNAAVVIRAYTTYRNTISKTQMK